MRPARCPCCDRPIVFALTFGRRWLPVDARDEGLLVRLPKGAFGYSSRSGAELHFERECRPKVAAALGLDPATVRQREVIEAVEAIKAKTAANLAEIEEARRGRLKAEQRIAEAEREIAEIEERLHEREVAAGWSGLGPAGKA